MILYILLFSAFAWSSSKCEPPVNSYLPPSTGNAGNPSSQYGPPEVRGNTRSGISVTAGNQRQNEPPDSYSPPGRSDSSIPLDTQYGPPSSGRGSGQGTTRPSQFSSPSQTEFQAPRSNNDPSKLYGVPGGARGQGNGPPERAGSTPFSGPNERPQTSYNSPSGRGFGKSESDSRSNDFGPSGSGFDKRPDSSYGPPPSGDVRSRNGGRSNEGLQAGPESSFSAPLRDGGANSYNENPPLSGAPSSSYGTPGFSNGPGGRGTGQSGSSFGDESDEPAKYEFSYDVDDAQSGTKFGHSEQRDGDTATGQYNVELPDGRKQVVEYEAGLQGYKPQIRYEGGTNGAAGAFGNGNNGPQGGSGGYPKEGLRGSSNDIGYPESGYDGRPGKYQQTGDFNQGGPGSSDQDFMGYPRGGPGGTGGSRQQNRGGSPGESKFEGQPHYPSGNGDNVRSLNGGGRGGRPFPNADNEDSEGYPRGGPQGNNRNSQGNNRKFSNEGVPGPYRGQSSMGASGNGRNNGDEGYPRGGPSGPRGSGY